MPKVCVVIPVHKEVPDEKELISFQQCFRVLKDHTIIVIAPNGLDLKIYKEAVPNFETISIHPRWQSSLLNYNKLKLSKFFYSLFEEYDFLLTYELDAFIFKDELGYWCSKGYDYIGAPWVMLEQDQHIQFNGVGNSGFSLRKISAIKNVLSRTYKRSEIFPGRKVNRLKEVIEYNVFSILNAFSENRSLQQLPWIHEDIFLCEVAPKKNPTFSIAPVNEALKFSFEVEPKKSFELNNHHLPMGCHAWWRYDLEFWRPHIESYGYKLTNL